MRKTTALAALSGSFGAVIVGGVLASDSTLALLSEGYTFVSGRCQRRRSDILDTRLMLEKVTCIMGEEAAGVFYRPGRFTRQGAMPQTTLKLLQDKGSVQQLDDEPHRRRKAMFLSLMSPAEARRLADKMATHWHVRLGEWESEGEIVLHDEAREALCRTVCEWAGVPLGASEASQRTRELSAMIEGAGAVGPRNWWGMLLRARSERWAGRLVEKVRAREIEVEGGSALHTIAWHREPDGELLETEVAAVELLNVLRPTVAVARYVTFAALALHEHPEARRELLAGGEDYLYLFVQEVRRFYPFFPFVGGRVRNEFEWRGRRFPEGSWMILDLYGTNHAPRIWETPEEFRPERFRHWNGGAFNFIPQGGGDHYEEHRCAGEWVTIELMKRAVRLLTESMSYEVPEQDLRINLSRMPAIPKSRFVLRGVRQTP